MLKKLLLLLTILIAIPLISCEFSPSETRDPTNTPTSITTKPTKTVVAPTVEPTNTIVQTTKTSAETLGPTSQTSKKTIIIASRDYAEHQLLSEISALVLQKKSDIAVEHKKGQGANTQQLIDGSIDIYWEFSGTVLVYDYGYLPNALPIEAEASLSLIGDLDKKRGLIWLEPLRIVPNYVLIVQKKFVEQDITTLDDLADFMNANNAAFTLCADSGFYQLRLYLQKIYNFQFKEENIETLGRDTNYEYLRDNKCDVAVGFNTDSRVNAWEFHILEDSKMSLPTQVVAPVTRQDLLNQHPEWEDLFREISHRLDPDTIIQLIRRVQLGDNGKPYDGDEESIEEVALDFVENSMFLQKIVVSSKQSTEHVWWGKMLVLLLSEAEYDVEDQTNLGNTDDVRNALVEGEIHLQWEMVSTALTQIHDLSQRSISPDPVRAYNLAQQSDAKEDLIWLKPAEKMTSTYALAVNPATKSEIQTLEELATFMNENDAPWRVCVEEQFETLPEGLHGMEEFYGFKFKEENIVRLAPYEIYQALQEGKCEVAQALTTGSHEAYGFRLLEDSQNFFLTLTPAPVIRKEVLDQFPELAELIGRVSPLLDGRKMEALNRRIEVGADGVPNSGDEESPEAIARFVLCEAGLLKECAIMAESDEKIDEEMANSCNEIIINGSFESDGNWELPTTALPAEYSTERFHSGERALRLGLTEADDRVSHSVARQRVVIPQDATTATLSYWYYPISSELDDGNDVQGGQIYHTESNSPQGEFLRVASNEQAWVLDDYDLSDFIGQEVVLYFYVDNYDDGQPSAMYVDDVSVQVCTGSP